MNSDVVSHGRTPSLRGESSTPTVVNASAIPRPSPISRERCLCREGRRTRPPAAKLRRSRRARGRGAPGSRGTNGHGRHRDEPPRGRRHLAHDRAVGTGASARRRGGSSGLPAFRRRVLACGSRVVPPARLGLPRSHVVSRSGPLRRPARRGRSSEVGRLPGDCLDISSVAAARRNRGRSRRPPWSRLLRFATTPGAR
jgi:hypothetical protein